MKKLISIIVVIACLFSTAFAETYLIGGEVVDPDDCPWLEPVEGAVYVRLYDGNFHLIFETTLDIGDLVTVELWDAETPYDPIDDEVIDYLWIGYNVYTGWYEMENYKN